MLNIPSPDQTGRILSHLDQGIKVENSRWGRFGPSISYSDKKGRTYYINRLSAVKFLQEHGATVRWFHSGSVILKAIQKICPPTVQAEQGSKKRLGALIRGYQVRSRTILPTRISQFLEERFVTASKTVSTEKNLSQMAILISRRVNNELSNPDNGGKSFLITSLQGCVNSDYPLKKSKIATGLLGRVLRVMKSILHFLQKLFRLKPASAVELKVDLWMTLSKDRKTISLQFKPKDAPLLGKGGYRAVFAAEDINIDMQPKIGKEGYSKKTTKNPSVRVYGVNDQFLPGSSSYERLERGTKVHKSAFLQLTEAKKLGLLQGVYLTTPHETLQEGVAKQVRYGADLEMLLKKGGISQGFGPEAKGVQITKVQLLQSVRDLALALKWLNDQEIIHRDVKLGNINVSWVKDDKGIERPVAYLADFDFAKEKFGYDRLAFEYDYYAWDPCSSFANIATPYTDLYGAAMIFCNAMVPAVGWKWFDETKKAIQSAVEKGKSFETTQYIPQGLDEHQQKAFVTFCGICYESSLLLEELKWKRGFPYYIGSEQVKATISSLQMRGLLKHTMDGLINLIDREIKRYS